MCSARKTAFQLKQYALPRSKIPKESAMRT